MQKIPEGAMCVHRGILFDTYQKQIEQFDGSMKTFEWLRAYDLVKTICIVNDQIIILEEKQPGNITKRLGLPGGFLERGEDPLSAAKREVEEETGIKFETYESLVTLPVYMGATESYRHYYIAKNPSHFGEQSLDEGGEHITLHYYSFEQFIDLVKTQDVFVWVLGDWIIRNYILPDKEGVLKDLLFGEIIESSAFSAFRT